jgi:hypothetical protein
MDGAPDIGFDERGLVICAGNWGNDSNSHNEPGFMHQKAAVGAPTRYFILPRFAGGYDLNAASRHLRLHDTTVTPVAPSTGNGWINPPGSLGAPVNLGSLPLYYRSKYISFANSMWTPISLTGQNLTWLPQAGLPIQPPASFQIVSLTDNECGGVICSHDYFNFQGVIVDAPSATQELLRSNLQAEYR